VPARPGPREWWVVGRARDRRPYVMLAHSGGSTFHPTSTRNLAVLMLLAADRPGTRVLNCGDPDPPGVRELVRAVAEAVDYHPIEVLLPGPPRGPVGESPWTAPAPFVLDMTAAAAELDYRPVLTYPEAVRETCAWLLTETASRAWQEVLPSMAAAADAIFPYELEDTLLRELGERAS
jgi:nucleoside-diphosphate-sugar epimerase